MAGLASCEMKEELLGGEKNYTELGFLDLGVAVNASQNVVTKAEDDGGVSDDGITGGSTVSADEFPVTITGTVAEDGEDYSKNFESYEALQNENPVELPVGTYTITAHSNLELMDQMPEPYYEGSAEKISITKDVTSEAKVICKMKNTKIQMVYPTDFIEAFDSWTITISDGVGKILTFTHEDLNPKAIYWLISAEQKTLTVEIEAKNSDGETIRDSRVLEKPEGGNSDFWTGGDALTITMKPQADSGDPTGSGIGISVDITFDETSETIPVPVTPGTGTEEPDPGPGTEEPDEPTGDAPTLSGKYLKETVNYDKAGELPDVKVVMNVPNKIQNVFVKADTSDEGLKYIFGNMGFMTGEGVDLVTADGSLGEDSADLSGLFELPTTDLDEYTFELGGLASYLTVGTHSFTVKVVDQKGLSASGTLNIVVTDSSSQGE